MDSAAASLAVVVALRAAGCVFAEDEAALLIAAARDGGSTDGVPEGGQDETTPRLAGLVARRVAGEPLEQILGWAEFRGLRIAVAPGVFVPRFRSSVLVTTALSLIPPGASVVDLCCGSGAIAVALLAARPDITVHATDLDPVAVACARVNLTPLGGFTDEGDLFDALPCRLRGRIDMVVANAPYVPAAAIATMPPEARDHEHRIALDGGSDGLDIQRRILSAAAEWLAPGGHLLIETSREQAEATAETFSRNGFQPRIVYDDDVDGTAVLGRRTA